MSRRNHRSLASISIIAIAISLPAAGGEPAVKNPAPASIPPAVDPWEITISPYGWAAGLSGVTGVKGYTMATDVPFSEIFSHLDMTAMLNIEARKGRWGGWVDGLYLKMSADKDLSGSLLDSVGLSVEQVVAEAALFYRVWEGGRGFVDVYAGARYMSVGGDLSFNVNDAGMRQVSDKISEAVIDQVVDEVNAKGQARLAAARAQIASQITEDLTQRVAEATSRVEDARNTARTSIATAASAKGAEVRSSIEQLQQISAAHPRLVEVLRSSSRLEAAVRSVVEARIDQKVAAASQDLAAAEQALAQARQNISAAAQAAIARAEAALATAQAAADSARSKAAKAVSKAEKKLAGEIEDALRDAIPDEISDSADWVDPFVGLRARYNFNSRLYAIARADIGGFGISSDLVWQAYGALGCHLTKSGRTTLELGYKHMDVDYTRGGFTYDVSVSGAMLTVGFKF